MRSIIELRNILLTSMTQLPYDHEAFCATLSQYSTEQIDSVIDDVLAGVTDGEFRAQWLSFLIGVSAGGLQFYCMVPWNAFMLLIDKASPKAAKRALSRPFVPSGFASGIYSVLHGVAYYRSAGELKSLLAKFPGVYHPMGGFYNGAFIESYKTLNIESMLRHARSSPLGHDLAKKILVLLNATSPESTDRLTRYVHYVRDDVCESYWPLDRFFASLKDPSFQIVLDNFDEAHLKVVLNNALHCFRNYCKPKDFILLLKKIMDEKKGDVSIDIWMETRPTDVYTTLYRDDPLFTLRIFAHMMKKEKSSSVSASQCALYQSLDQNLALNEPDTLLLQKALVISIVNIAESDIPRYPSEKWADISSRLRIQYSQLDFGDKEEINGSSMLLTSPKGSLFGKAGASKQVEMVTLKPRNIA
ncbi:MAG: hypothetical protein ACHQAX_07920 [Gammaproteobacteria bacterium]